MPFPATLLALFLLVFATTPLEIGSNSFQILSKSSIHPFNMP